MATMTKTACGTPSKSNLVITSPEILGRLLSVRLVSNKTAISSARP